MKIAVLGANGFIGSRTVEMLHLGGCHEVRPVVRTIESLARLSRFDIDWRVADARDRNALEAAVAGCEVVLHAIAGDRRTILDTLRPTYEAAESAGVRRLVYLSSASVHGQSPSPGTDESSPLDPHQPLPYNTSKILAERRLAQLRDGGTVELVILRPGIVYGPRSVWVTRFASDLLARQAYLMDAGRGIFNGLYVDNLVEAVLLAAAAPAADREAFLVGDAETVTWADFYSPIAASLGFELGALPDVTYASPRFSLKDRLRAQVESRRVQAMASALPSSVRTAIGAGIYALLQEPQEPLADWTLPHHLTAETSEPVVTLEMALLYQCAYKLPHDKARSILGYTPIVTFEEACRRTIGWLEFAGYHTVQKQGSGNG